MTKSENQFRASRLTDSEREDTRRLKSLFDKKAELSQKDFGARWGIGSPGMMSQYLTGKRSIGLAAAIKFAKGLGVEVADISPTLAQQLPRPTQVRDDKPESVHVSPPIDKELRMDALLTELQAIVDGLAPVLQEPGRAALLKWIQGHASTQVTTATLRAYQEASKALPTAPAALIETPVRRPPIDHD